MASQAYFALAPDRYVKGILRPVHETLRVEGEFSPHPVGTSGGTSNWSSGFLPSTYQGVVFRSAGDPVLYLSNPAAIERGVADSDGPFRAQPDLRRDVAGDLDRRPRPDR